MGELAGELAPRGIEDAAVQARLGGHVLASGLGRAFGTGRHVRHLEVFDGDHRVAIRQVGRELVKPSASLQSDPAVDVGESVKRCLPIGAALVLARHRTLRVLEPSLLLLQHVERRDHLFVRRGGQRSEAQVDIERRLDIERSDGVGGSRLDRREPLRPSPYCLNLANPPRFSKKRR